MIHLRPHRLLLPLLLAASVLALPQSPDSQTAGSQPQDQQSPYRQSSPPPDCSGPLSSLNPDCQVQSGGSDYDDVNGADSSGDSGSNADLSPGDSSGTGNDATGGDWDNAAPGDDSGSPDFQNLRMSRPLPDDLSNTPAAGRLYQNQQRSRGQIDGYARRRLNSSRERELRLRRQPLSEFQKFVEASTGQVLPIFGENLFNQVPSTFAPINRVPVTSDYVIGPGDQILLRVWGHVTMNRQLTVDRSGDIYISQVGDVHVAGLQFQQLNGFLYGQLCRVFRNFEMNVSMGRLRSIQVFVTGQARRPGVYTVSSLSTVVDALFASGGPTPEGSLRHIELKRGSETVTDFDLYDLLLHGDRSKDARLRQGDVIYIPSVGPQAAIAGSVKSPGIYEMKGERDVEDLIRIASGLTAMADTQQATLERVANHESREVLTLPLHGAGLETPVRDGDILRIVPVLPRFANTVTLRGNVANPGNFAWHPGMRLRDIIPDKASLMTRNYWQKRNLLGYISPLESGPADPRIEARRKPSETKIGAVAPPIDWSYAVIQRQNARNLSDQLIPFNLGKLVLDGDQSQNLPLQPGDVVTIFSQADFGVTVLQQTRYVTLEGEFNAAGVYEVQPGETLGQVIQRAGGLSPAAYLYGAQFLRKSVRIEQQRRLDQFISQMEQHSQQLIGLRLASASPEEASTINARADMERQRIQQLRSLQATGRIVLDLTPGSNDISKLMNIQLQNGDRFIVPPRPATVNVIGAVYNPSAFLQEPGLTIRDYLAKAGGCTRVADKSHIYLIQADGSVVARSGHESLLGKAFDSRHLQPGDTIVVPEEILKTTFMKGMRDWSQIVTGFGLGAAAVNVLR